LVAYAPSLIPHDSYFQLWNLFEMAEKGASEMQKYSRRKEELLTFMLLTLFLKSLPHQTTLHDY
jgi:hypothetical protein